MHRTQREIEWIEGFFVKSFCESVESYLYPQTLPLRIEVTVDKEPIPFAELDERSFREIKEGEQWGENWDSAWFRLTGTVPAEWRGKEVAARLHFGGEACVFDHDGEPQQGLTGASVHLVPFVRDLYRLYPCCEGGEEVSLLVEASASQLWGVPKGDIPVAPTGDQFQWAGGPVGVVHYAQIGTFDEEMYQLYFDTTVLYRLMTDLPEDDVLRARIRERLQEARTHFRRDKPDAKAIRELLAPLFALKASGAEPTTISVGHAHIDTAWLWPMRESIRKCVRSFSTQIGLMERYPDYVFGTSQVPHYLFMKDNYPGLYEKIKKAIADGRWEVQGAMWVETDCNLPRGESLVRQLLYGKRFFEQEFGVDVRNAWLPDVFGYPACLPQLLRQAGVEFFVSQKLSWNSVNRFPHHTFHWKGIDGTTVISHLLPMESYNGQLFPDRNRFGARNHEEKATIPEYLTCFGIGDGGGGPSDKHIEFGLRQRDLAGCPKVVFGSAQSQLDRLAQYSDHLGTWDGPLYVERHQGTLTTHARMKRRNRKIENQLRELELRFAAGDPADYPRDTLRECWHPLLTNQFHDILPGSSITRVYEDAHRQYDEIERTLDELEQRLDAAAPRDDVVFNPNSRPFTGVVPSTDGQWVAVEAKPLGTTRLADASTDVPSDRHVTTTEETLENDLLRYTFDDRGTLISAYDKQADRELIDPADPGNLITLYEDVLGDAWDSDAHYRDQVVEHARLKSRRVVANEPLVGELALEFAIGGSTITQTLRLRAMSRRLDFVTHVQWKERGRQLRVGFPVRLRTQQSTTEIQFGLQNWSTSTNHSWERAQTDVPAYRFADLSESDYGVALLNDCKYGYHIKEQTLDLHLMRASVYPDETADQGDHEFTYSLLPHLGRLEQSDVFFEAEALNQPVRVVSMPGCDLPLRIAAQGVVVEAVKLAEDSDDLLLRLYESRGQRERITLAPARNNAVTFHGCSLLEKAGEPLPTNGDVCEVEFAPFEIKTVMCRR